MQLIRTTEGISEVEKKTAVVKNNQNLIRFILANQVDGIISVELIVNHILTENDLLINEAGIIVATENKELDELHLP